MLRHFRRKGGHAIISIPPGPLADMYANNPQLGMEEVFFAPGEEFLLSNPQTPPAAEGQDDELPQ